MPHEIEITVNAILALIAILNPIGNVPLFSDLTSDLDRKTRQQLFNLTVLTGFVTLIVMTFSGRWIMEYVFQIKIDEFRIAGGILLTVIAVEKIAFSHTAHHEHAGNVMEMGVVPMAIPLLVGPGAIVTSILILDRDGWLISLIALTAAFALTWTIFRFSGVLTKLFGKVGNLVLSRVLYIFIAAIGVHFLLSGISSFFKLG